MSGNYLNSTKKQFKYYKGLGDKTFEQLSDEELHWTGNSHSNSIAIVVKHIVGNMLSRWTNFLEEDGEKPWRMRDTEFIDPYSSRKEMLQAWEKAWKCFFEAIEPLKEEDLERIVYIRNEGHQVIEAINRQLAHYAYHIGQIVYIGTQIKGHEWKNLSLAKGKSESYNKRKFEQNKHRGHYTDDLL